MGRCKGENKVEGVFASADQLREYMENITRGRTFFITDTGFAGASTPGVQEGDMVALVFGMMRAAALHPVEPTSLGTNVEVQNGDVLVDFHRIAGFAYVGCHDRKVLRKGRMAFRIGQSIDVFRMEILLKSLLCKWWA
jgi:hypothetical protein